MAINKDSGDSRTYTSSISTAFQWRIPTVANSTTPAGDAPDWPGKVGGLSLSYAVVIPVASTFTSETPWYLKGTGGGSGGSYTYDVAEVSHATDHVVANHTCRVIPGLHLIRGSVGTLSNGEVWIKAFHATDDSSSMSVIRS